jgi:heparan-alpha-glucosaminide N-acetyltransferase
MRIASIDIYRGMVMFLMLAEMLHLDKLKNTIKVGDGWVANGLDWLSFHTTHVAWRGCSLHDMIQPSFTFLVGTAMAFSLVARATQGQSWQLRFAHALWRSLVLVFLGIFLRSLSKPYTNFTFDDTLTQIGLGYWILFLLSELPIRGLVLSLSVILVGYWMAFVLYPAPGADFPYPNYGVPANWPEHYSGIAAHFNKNSNLAWAVDRWWMNLFYREKPFEFSGGGYATLSFIPTLGTMLLGLVAGRILQTAGTAEKKQVWLWSCAAICILLAFVVDGLGLCPIVKRIWTPSWVLCSGGLCFVWLAVLNAFCDIAGYKAWGFPFLVIGANSIVAYVMSWTIEDSIHKALERHFGWLIHWFNDWIGSLVAKSVGADASISIRPLMIGVLTLSVMWLVLFWLYRRKIFVKI